MRPIFPVFIFLFLTSQLMQAQPDYRFFSPDSLIRVGVYYYPEHWPENQWNRDFANMAKMGFEFTHIGEFAWHFLEPEEGRYEFEWMDKALALADKHGLKVILCTPTPTPPAWMSTRYPDILLRTPKHIVARHGSRQHISWSSARYRTFTREIVQRLAQRYGNDPRVIGWQLDNEPSHYGIEDHGEEATRRFRQWCRSKYGSLDLLNLAWGTRFWSEVYTDWDQILPPNAEELPGFINPHQTLDYKRFSADEAADFLKFQYDILRENIAKSQWITTNFMGFHAPIDPWRSRDLDFVSWTSYPVSGYDNGHGDQGFRRGRASTLSFINDFYRPMSPLTGAMELQISQVCWGPIQPRMYPGSRKALLYHTLAGGNSFVCSYRFRTPTFNYEQDILGMVGPDGVTPTDGGLEYAEFIREVKKLRKTASRDAKMPEELARRKTAILWNADNLWQTSNVRHTDSWWYTVHQQGYHSALKSIGCPVDYIAEDHDFSAYPWLIAPAYELVDSELVDKWENYAEKGGNLILTCRTGVRNRSGWYWEAPRAQPIYDLIGAEVEFFDNLPPKEQGTVGMNGKTYIWNSWAESLKPRKGTEVVASQTNQFWQGSAVITHRKLGKGTVTYVGVDSQDKTLEKDLVVWLFGRQGVPVENYPESLVVEWRHGFWFAINYDGQSVKVPLPEGAKLISGKAELGPSEVVVWR